MPADVGITIICGAPGGGKSLMAVEDIAYNPGRIVGNIRLTPQHPAFNRYEYLPSEYLLQMEDQPGKKTPKIKGFWEWPALQRNYTIYIDEADIYFACEDHRMLAGYLHRFLKQHRKRNIRLVFIVQSVENIWVKIRRLAQDVVLCHKDSSGRDGWLPGFLQRFVRVRYSNAKMTKEIGRASVRERDAAFWFGCYDTRELI